MNRLSMLATLVLFLALATGPVLAQSGYDLYQQALVKERAVGDVEEALRLYQRIVHEFSNNHALAAKAQLRMALLYDRLGRKGKAQRNYQAIVSSYSDQSDITRQAQAKIVKARLAPKNKTTGANNRPAGISVQQVWTGPKVVLGTVSSDGRYLSAVDRSTGNLVLHDLETGKDRPLTNKGSWLDSFEMAEESVISPDGRQVAYSWLGKDRYDLRVVSTTGNEPATPRVLYASDDLDWIDASAWSPDGKWIAVQIWRDYHAGQIGIVNAADGALRILKAADWRTSTKMFFSPDSKFLTFDVPTSEKSEARDVFVLAIDGSGEIPAVVHPANDVTLGWTPDGRHLLFGSDRSGSMSLWSIGWSNGKVEGNPELIKSDINLSNALGMTREGMLYYGVTLGGRDIYVASFDAHTGEVTNQVRPIERFVGQNSSPDWSPDGKYLAYLSKRNLMVDKGTVLAIRSMETGETRELRPKLNNISRPRWAPDGRSIAIGATDYKGIGGVYRIDVETGEVSPIVLYKPGDSFGTASPQWSPDGKKIFYRRYIYVGKDSHVVVLEHDLQSGINRELVRDIGYTSVSPNGRYLAYVSDSLMVMPIERGQPRTLIRLQKPQSLWNLVAWTPDSRSIVFAKSMSPNDDKRELWLIDLDGGQARKLDLPKVRDFRFNPRTNQIAFTAGDQKYEVWKLENFLPAAKPRSTSVSRR